ncbi:hypothetical protein P5F56_02195 [Clostridium perfringens]|nr:hypothetical protein [Clostridium perfringens]
MSKRFYITLNPNKDKDLVILKYLSSTYNESETIKSILYQTAVNRCYEVNLESNKCRIEINEEVLNMKKGAKEVQNGGNIKSDIKAEIDDEIKNLFG